MPNEKYSARAKCPFYYNYYHRAEGDKIVCTDYNGFKVSISEKSAEMLVDKWSPYCWTMQYAQCPFYQYILERIEK